MKQFFSTFGSDMQQLGKDAGALLVCLSAAFLLFLSWKPLLVVVGIALASGLLYALRCLIIPLILFVAVFLGLLVLFLYPWKIGIAFGLAGFIVCSALKS